MIYFFERDHFTQHGLFPFDKVHFVFFENTYFLCYTTFNLMKHMQQLHWNR